MSLEQTILAAQGYIELEMPNEALREIALLDPADQLRDDVLQIQLFILMCAKRWEDGVAICQKLQQLHPEMTVGYVHGAFCLHEIGRTEEAKTVLLKGPTHLLQEPTYYYNLACYDAILGNLKDAEHNLRISFQMDKKFREIAKQDPDLKELNCRISDDSF